jgi:NADH:ubiquinone oxidoreductase subunit 3 (subunit A)
MHVLLTYDKKNSTQKITMIIRYVSLASLLLLFGIAVCLIVGKTSYADGLGVLTFCLYAFLVIVTVITWLSEKEK